MKKNRLPDNAECKTALDCVRVKKRTSYSTSVVLGLLTNQSRKRSRILSAKLFSGEDTDIDALPFIPRVSIISSAGAALGVVLVFSAFPAQKIAHYFKSFEDSGEIIPFKEYSYRKFPKSSVPVVRFLYEDVIKMTINAVPGKFFFLGASRATWAGADALSEYFESERDKKIVRSIGFVAGIEASAQGQGRVTFCRTMQMYHNLAHDKLLPLSEFKKNQYRPQLQNWIKYNRIANGVTFFGYEACKSYLEKYHPDLKEYHKHLSSVGVFGAQIILAPIDRNYTLKMMGRNATLSWAELLRGRATRHAMLARIVWKFFEGEVGVVGSDGVQDYLFDQYAKNFT